MKLSHQGHQLFSKVLLKPSISPYWHLCATVACPNPAICHPPISFQPVMLHGEPRVVYHCSSAINIQKVFVWTCGGYDWLHFTLGDTVDLLSIKGTGKLVLLEEDAVYSCNAKCGTQVMNVSLKTQTDTRWVYSVMRMSALVRNGTQQCLILIISMFMQSNFVKHPAITTNNIMA